jgi:acyl-coenzyme A synthetase/AMP-(fatty) acid ligase
VTALRESIIVAELAEIFLQACRDSRFSIRSSGPRLDMAQLQQQVARLRLQLRAQGRQTGDVVLFHGQQGAAAFVTFWACALEALVFAPLDTSWPGFLLHKACARLRPASVLAEFPAELPWHELLPDCPVLSPRADAFADVAAVAAVAAPGDAPAVCLCTSGSTGDPKIVVLSRAALVHSAARVAAVFDWQPGETLLNLPEPHTMSGLRNAFLVAPLLGMHWVALPSRQRGYLFDLLAVMKEAEVQRLVAAPLLLRQFNLLGRRLPREDMAALRAVYCTGADLHAAEVRRFHDEKGIPVINYYGLTETVGICLSQDPQRWSVDDDSLGWPVGGEARLVDAAGQDAEEGELQVRLPHAAPFYLDDAEATARLLEGEWLRTGDLMRRDGDGRYRLLGRTGLFIKTTTTECVSPQEIEAVLEQHPAVSEAAVMGVADAHGGERIVALLVHAAETMAENWEHELGDFVRRHLGPARVPSRFHRVAVLPRSSNGKILRKQLSGLLNEA